MESGYGSPRADKFPAGLRVLVVDDDPTWVKILEKMLKKCSYEVTTCCLARDALNMLRERKDGFDLVISDVNMPDMDGFKLLEHVGLEMDLPVIMMSVDGETSRVMKGVQHGACDYLLKPIRMKELSNIWQHVLRKKIHDAKDTDYYECIGNFQLIKNKSEDFHDGLLSNGCSLGTLKKRKEVENKNHDDQESGDPLSSKKARVVWSVDLHQKFVDAVNQIGFDKVGPKKILDTMKVPGLTRENVASHLQKFRLYLGRLQKENEVKDSLRGTKPLDFPAGDPPRSFGFQNSFAVDQNNSINDSFGHTRDTIPVDDMGQKVHESELKGMVSFLPARKIKNPLTGDLPDHHHKSSIPSQIDPTHSIKLLDQSFEYRSLESTLPTQQWNEVPMMQFKQPLKHIPKQEPKPFSRLEVNYAAPLFSGPVSEHHFHLNFQHPSPSADMQMPVSENDGRIEFPVDSAINSIPLTADCPIISQEAFKATSTITSTMKKKMVDQHCIDNWTPVQQKIIAGGKALVPSLEENIQFLLQEYGCGENFGFQNCYYNPEFIDEPQTDCYGQLGVYWDKLRDSIESTFADQGLFIA